MAWPNAEQVVIYRGVEYTVTATGEPEVWQWRFQIGDEATSGKTRTRLIHLATRRVHMRIDATRKASGQADCRESRNI